jgi:hypothetical protein
MDSGYWYYLEGVGVTVMFMVVLASLASLRSRHVRSAGEDDSSPDSEVYGVSLTDRRTR